MHDYLLFLPSFQICTKSLQIRLNTNIYLQWISITEFKLPMQHHTRVQDNMPRWIPPVGSLQASCLVKSALVHLPSSLQLSSLTNLLSRTCRWWEWNLWRLKYSIRISNTWCITAKVRQRSKWSLQNIDDVLVASRTTHVHLEMQILGPSQVTTSCATKIRIGSRQRDCVKVEVLRVNMRLRGICLIVGFHVSSTCWVQKDSRK